MASPCGRHCHHAGLTYHYHFRRLQNKTLILSSRRTSGSLPKTATWAKVKMGEWLLPVHCCDDVTVSVMGVLSVSTHRRRSHWPWLTMPRHSYTCQHWEQLGTSQSYRAVAQTRGLYDNVTVCKSGSLHWVHSSGLCSFLKSKKWSNPKERKWKNGVLWLPSSISKK